MDGCRYKHICIYIYIHADLDMHKRNLWKGCCVRVCVHMYSYVYLYIYIYMYIAHIWSSISREIQNMGSKHILASQQRVSVVHSCGFNQQWFGYGSLKVWTGNGSLRAIHLQYIDNVKPSHFVGYSLAWLTPTLEVQNSEDRTNNEPTTRGCVQVSGGRTRKDWCFGLVVCNLRMVVR